MQVSPLSSDTDFCTVLFSFSHLSFANLAKKKIKLYSQESLKLNFFFYLRAYIALFLTY
jgi:hypothetical protein